MTNAPTGFWGGLYGIPVPALFEALAIPGRARTGKVQISIQGVNSDMVWVPRYDQRRPTLPPHYVKLILGFVALSLGNFFFSPSRYKKRTLLKLIPDPPRCRF